jgi:hypothetical protein
MSIWNGHNWSKLEPHCHTSRSQSSALFFIMPCWELPTFCRLLLHLWQATATLDLLAGGGRSTRSWSSTDSDMLAEYLSPFVCVRECAHPNVRLDSLTLHGAGETRTMSVYAYGPMCRASTAVGYDHASASKEEAFLSRLSPRSRNVPTSLAVRRYFLPSFRSFPTPSSSQQAA